MIVDRSDLRYTLCGDIIVVYYVPTMARSITKYTEVQPIMKRQKKRTRKPANKKYHSRKAGRKQGAVPKTAEQFFVMPEPLQDRWIGVTNVISKMRADGVSLTEASQEFGLDRREVVRLGVSALRKRANGQYAAKANDRLLRVILVLTEEGKREIAVRDSRQATFVAEHWNAVHRYLERGDASALNRSQGKTIIDAKGKRIRLLTNLEELNRLGNAGVLSFESLYARAA